MYWSVGIVPVLMGIMQKALQPAGDYHVDHDEEAIEGASWLGWQRVGAFTHLPGIGMHGLTQQMVPINPADLDAALEKDRQP